MTADSRPFERSSETSSVKTGSIRLRSVRRQITLPFLVMAVALPLAALVVFNIGMSLYLLQGARSDLRANAGMVEAMIRQLNADGAVDPGATLNDRARERLADVRTVLRTSRPALGSDIMILDRNGRILYPADAAATSPGPAVQQRFHRQLAEEFADFQSRSAQSSDRIALTSATAQIHSLQTQQGRYLFIGLPLLRQNPERGPTLVFFTRITLTNGLMRFINLLLIGIFLIGALISMWLVRRTAAGIEQPLQALNAFAERIGHGDFTPAAASPASGSGRTASRELAELAGRMNQMAERLAQADRLQKTFLQNASHELRTPLMAIQGYAEGLASGVILDTPRAAGIIRDESLRLKRLVEELLALSRIENRTGQLTLEKENLADRVREVVARLDAAAQREGRRIQVDASTQALPVLQDEDMLNQVLMNLMANAIRYATQLVTVRVFRDGDDAVVTVEDDGPGIPESALPHVFERFYKGSGGQFGLGLAIAESAAAALHGRLIAGNRVSGPGAVFTLRLPLATA